MKRAILAVSAVLGLALATLAFGPSAQAVTNPADNPQKITVKGDDGNTYTDGQDTLPGYDDDECTYIPGAYFDFDNNRVRYADGQSIPWTEWDRATGYKQWLANKENGTGSGGSGGSTPKPPKTPTTPKPSTSKTPTSGGSTSTTKGNGSSGSTTTGSGGTTGVTDGATTGVTPTDGATADATTAAGAKATAGTPTDSATGAIDEVTLAAGSTSVTPTSAKSGGTGSAGLLILGGLAGAGLITFGGYSVFGRSRKSAS